MDSHSDTISWEYKKNWDDKHVFWLIINSCEVVAAFELKQWLFLDGFSKFPNLFPSSLVFEQHKHQTDNDLFLILLQYSLY
jgi:hypothetical protein